MKNSRTTKILIMCGGKGRRLGKVGKMLPKCLMKIKDKAILDLKLRNYLRQGFRDFILCIGHKGDLVKKAVAHFGIPSIRCAFSKGPEPAGILKRLYMARDLFEQNVILTYGDTYADMDIKELLNVHRRDRNEATIVVAPIQSPFGLVEFDKNQKAVSFKEKPILNYYIGYGVINKSALDLVPPKVIDMPDGEGIVTFYKILLAMGKLGVFYHPGFQITFNTEDELKIAQEKIVSFYTTREQQ